MRARVAGPAALPSLALLVRRLPARRLPVDLRLLAHAPLALLGLPLRRLLLRDRVAHHLESPRATLRAFLLAECLPSWPSIHKIWTALV